MRAMKFGTYVAVMAALLACGFRDSVRAADATVKIKSAAATKIDSDQYRKTVDRGVAYLLKVQNPDGSFNDEKATPAITALVTAGLLQAGQSPDSPAVAKSLKYMEKFVQPDGGIYKPGSSIQNYETSISIMCFAAANKDGRYKDLIKK